MLELSNALLNQPVMSLRASSQVAVTAEPIVNPNNLKIEGFYCIDSVNKKRLILLAQDIRDIIAQGVVINDYDVLVEPEDLVRLKSVLNLNFQLLGKPVVTDSKKKLGKVNDFATEAATMFVQKLYVSQSLLKSLSSGQLSVDRNQIVEITSKHIVIKDPQQPTKASAPAAMTSVAT